MTVVSGDIRLVTDKPDSVSQVWLRAPKGRVQGTAYVTESPDVVPVEDGAVSFTALPGPLVMVLVAQGQPLNSVKLIVPDKPTATLRECIEAVGLVDDGTLSTLEALAIQIAADAARVGTAAQVGTWATEAKKSETNSKQSESNANAAADSAAVSAAEAKTAETRAEGHEANSLAAAERAEFAAEETIQQVEGDFATRNYVDALRPELDAKADASTVNDLAALTTGVTGVARRNSSRIQELVSELVTKADQAGVDAALEGKADTGTVDELSALVVSALGVGRGNADRIRQLEAGENNHPDLTEALATKADTHTLDARVPTGGIPGQLLMATSTGGKWSWAGRFPTNYHDRY